MKDIVKDFNVQQKKRNDRLIVTKMMKCVLESVQCRGNDVIMYDLCSTCSGFYITINIKHIY